MIGPLFAGAALAAFGMVACFALNGISFLFVIAAVLALRNVHVPALAAESMAVQLRGGLRFVQSSRNLITVMALGFFGAFLGAPVLTLLPVITRDVFHRDVGFYTDLMTFSGAGAVIGGLGVAWVAGYTMPNAASAALHERFGFSEIGVFTEVGRKFGKYWDVCWMERHIDAVGNQ